MTGVFMRRRGYTLIELLIAITIALWVGLGVYKALSNGIAVWKKVSSYRTRVDAAIFFDKIAQDLKNGSEYGDECLHGEAHILSFARHDTVGLFMDGVSDRDDIRDTILYRVEYVYIPQEKVIRRKTYSFGSHKPLSDRIVCDSVDDVTFSYCQALTDDGTAFLTTYEGSYPKMVVIEMVLKGSGERRENIRRMIVLPGVQ